MNSALLGLTLVMHAPPAAASTLRHPHKLRQHLEPHTLAKAPGLSVVLNHC